MRVLARLLLTLIVFGGLALAGAFVVAGYQPGPVIDVRAPERFVGQQSQLEFSVEAPGGQFSRVEAVLEQDGMSVPVFSMEPDQQPGGEVKQESSERIWVMRPIGKQAIPELKPGPARLTVTATRPVLYGLRQVGTIAVRDLEVRLEPPRAGVTSLHHFVNHGGAEFVVFRATPADVSAGVRVGTVSFPAFPGSAVGIEDPAVRVAFFALAHDQDLNAPIAVFARDPAGNEVTSDIERRLTARPFAKSRIDVDDRFLQRIVPTIAQNTPGEEIETSDLLQGFLRINNDLRRQNNETIAALAAKTAPQMLWREAFSQLGNTAVQSRFADYRTYFHNGKEIDRQVHLGFDLASLQQAPVPASNSGTVIFANYLGIYGNCVVLDHGLGVQSLYAHLSTIDVREGDAVQKGHVLGRTGTTGLAGGDHLHFTMLVNGVAVNPIEWWSAQWMEDRVFRKVREANGQAPTLTYR
jgi:murein DD-endopeptidase MepM/ murein hydrolase activator NlpD